MAEGEGSLIGQLKERRKELLAEQVRDVPVPLWTAPELALRIKPVEQTLIRRTMARVEKAPANRRGEAEMDAQAAVVAAAVLKVLIGSGDGQATVDLFDMKSHLDLPEDGTTAAAVIRAICLRDGDVMALASAVMEHSGYSDRNVSEVLAGE